jgi:hypothetical protein
MLDSPTTRWPRCRIVARRLGDCELLKKIGSGGMAEVWMGRKATVGGVSKAVAVKLMAGALAADPRYRRMFLEEARVSMMLTHSNIVQVFDVGQEGDYGYLVMEWVDGLNLAQIGQLLRDSNSILPLFATAHIVGEVARALAYAHTVTNEGASLGVIHRDVSPQNVLVSVSGEVKLTDFGVARVAHEDTSGQHVKGKLRYMAPEQLAGRSSAPTVDLYALGAVLHELLDGQKFRHDVDDVQLYGQVVGGVIPALRSSDIPPELEELRLALLQADPSRRLRSAEDVLVMLGRWPGYRNAAAELAKICRQYSGVDAPRSGLFRHAGTGTRVPTWEAIAGQPAVEVVPTQTAQTRAQSHDAATPAPGEDVAVTRTSHADGPTLPMPARPGVKVGREAILAAGVALCVVAAVGFAVKRYLLVAEDPALASFPPVVESPEPEVEPAPPAVAVGPAPAPVEETPSEIEGSTVGLVSDGRETGSETQGPVLREKAPQPMVKGSRDERRRKEAQGEPQKGEDVAEAKESSTEPKRSSRPQKVELHLRLNGPRLAYIRVNRGRVFILEPAADTKLPAGRYTLFWRLFDDDPWHDGGVFKLNAGDEYTVEVTETGLELLRH